MNTTLIVYILVLICGVVALSLFLKMRVKAATAKACAMKAATSIMFILSWLLLALKHPGNTSMFIGLGLVFGMLGDIWLDLKFCYPADDDLFTKLGFGSFALGHFAYIAAVCFGMKGKFNILSVVCAAGVALLAALVVYFGEGVMKLTYGNFKMISTLYGALLFFVTGFAIFTAVFSGIKDNMQLLVMGIGGVFFVISDLILSGTYFGEGKNRSVDIITNHVTYYLAQFIIAGSLWLMK